MDDFVIKKTTSSNRTIRMPDTLIEQVSTLSAEQNISFNQLVIQCCEYALAHLQDNPFHATKKETD